MASQPILDQWPEWIRMRGLPLALQGWNAPFQRTPELSDGCPVYRLNAYVLYGLFAIIGVRIQRENGLWAMFRDGEKESIAIKLRMQLGPDPSPIGEGWSYGGYTTEGKDWISPDGGSPWLALICGALVAMLAISSLQSY